jgi:soluble lytic murein transglycosylase-like protein
LDIQPAVPPYGHVTAEAVQCAAQASVRYDVPELLLHAIIVKENGRKGQCTRNSNGTYDCGWAQINTSWLKSFAQYGIKLEHITNDTCVNINASAYILRDNFNKKRDWFNAIISYNLGPNNWTPTRYAIGHKYASDVVRNWWAFQSWVTGVPAPMQPTQYPVASKPKGMPRTGGRTVQIAQEGLMFEPPPIN